MRPKLDAQNGAFLFGDWAITADYDRRKNFK